MNHERTFLVHIVRKEYSNRKQIFASIRTNTTFEMDASDNCTRAHSRSVFGARGPGLVPNISTHLVRDQINSLETFETRPLVYSRHSYHGYATKLIRSKRSKLRANIVSFQGYRKITQISSNRPTTDGRRRSNKITTVYSTACPRAVRCVSIT